MQIPGLCAKTGACGRQEAPRRLKSPMFPHGLYRLVSRLQTGRGATSALRIPGPYEGHVMALSREFSIASNTLHFYRIHVLGGSQNRKARGNMIVYT